VSELSKTNQGGTKSQFLDPKFDLLMRLRRAKHVCGLDAVSGLR
jgi:hypothetical protein